MAKTKISEFSATAADNTDITNINIAEGCSPANVNNAIRSLMALLKDQQTGTSGDPFTVAGTFALTGGLTLDGTAGASGQVLLSAGSGNTPTWSSLGNMSTQNSTAVSITGGTITGITDLTVADGGTGASSITANSIILGNGTSALSGNLVAPGASGNILLSNGTTWTSSSSFDKSLNQSGYQKLPGGLIMQWGRSSTISSQSTLTVTYPIAFTTSVFSINVTPYGDEDISEPFVIRTTPSTTSFVIFNSGASSGASMWMAIGY